MPGHLPAIIGFICLCPDSTRFPWQRLEVRFDHPECSLEPELDGFRVIAYIEDIKNPAYSRGRKGGTSSLTGGRSADMTQYEEEAFNDGYQCGRNGKAVSDRMWEAPEHLEAWRQGFIAGDHDRQSFQSQAADQPAKRPPQSELKKSSAEQNPPSTQRSSSSNG